MFSIFKNRQGKGRRVYSRSAGTPAGGVPFHFPAKTLLRIGMAVGIVWMVLSLLRVCFFGGRILWKTIPGPRVRHIEVHAGETITAPLLLDYLQIEEGMPLFDRSRSFLVGLFSCDIREKQRRLLEKAPTLASATITRRMPDTIVISVTERVPVARLERFPFGVDRNGILFVRRRGIEGLPSIRGVHPASAGLGKKFAEGWIADAALELIDCLANGESMISFVDLAVIDVSKADYLECTFTDRRRAKVAWTEMGKGTPYGRRCLVAQLNGLAQAMASSRSRGRSRFDVTVPGHCFAN